MGPAWGAPSRNWVPPRQSWEVAKFPPGRPEPGTRTLLFLPIAPSDALLLPVASSVLALGPATAGKANTSNPEGFLPRRPCALLDLLNSKRQIDTPCQGLFNGFSEGGAEGRLCWARLRAGLLGASH